jgi:ABC-type multidrug transport system fused ATPase/permease subunit
MFKLIQQLFPLLTTRQRKQFYVLQLLVVMMAVGEIIGVASIAPFMALIGDMSLLHQDNLIAKLYQVSGVDTAEQFTFLLGVTVLVLLTLSASVSMLTIWRLSLFATKTGSEIAGRLYQHYMQQDWLFHASSSSAQLTKQIANEAQRVTLSVLLPLMRMNASLVLAIMMSTAVALYDPKIASVGLLVFLSAYMIVYKVVKKRLDYNGKTVSIALSQRYRLMNEGFGGIKDTILLGRQQGFIDRFQKTGIALAYSQGTNVTLAQSPRYLMELVAFGSIIALVLYLFKFYQGSLGTVLPILSVYALAGFKLIPAFQSIYANIALIRGNLAAFESIKEDLANSQSPNKTVSETRSNGGIKLKKSIRLKDIEFCYPSKTTPVLSQLNIEIKANTTVGVVGSSGSGKSTIIDIFLGLILPEKGQLLIDGVVITSKNVHNWQHIIGFVPQSIFLSEGTIAENVAFGIPKNKIDPNKIIKALKLSHLDGLITDLPKGIDTTVGERGVQLSGGQRQRIGIARAVYHDASVLVFDEATSALDGVTEKKVMDAIHELSGKKTIILVAHRLKTVKQCDTIFVIDQGRLVDQGAYDWLLQSNRQFKKMVEHA